MARPNSITSVNDSCLQRHEVFLQFFKLFVHLVFDHINKFLSTRFLIVFCPQLPTQTLNGKTLVFNVYDNDMFSHDLIGSVVVPFNTVDMTNTVDTWSEIKALVKVIKRAFDKKNIFYSEQRST